MVLETPARPLIDEASRAFYQHAIDVLVDAGQPFLLGGAFALAHFTGIERVTKDLDILVLADDCDDTLATLRGAGYRTEITFGHWLAKAFCGERFIDIIYGSGNGITPVDDAWFQFAVPTTVFDRAILLCPPEELLWSKAFIQERERFDGADIVHLIQRWGDRITWPRLLDRFGDHWRVLLSHLVLYGYVFPGERSRVPDWVYGDLLDRFTTEPAGADRLCRGTLLSRAQYLPDLANEGYRDARLSPDGRLSESALAPWTAAIGDSSNSAEACRQRRAA